MVGTISMGAKLKWFVVGSDGQPELRYIVLGMSNVRVVEGRGDGFAVWPASSRGTEDGISWGDAPALAGPPLARVGATIAGTRLELDVTRAISRDGRYTFVLAGGGTDSTLFASREGIFPPGLVVRP